MDESKRLNVLLGKLFHKCFVGVFLITVFVGRFLGLGFCCCWFGFFFFSKKSWE